MLLTLSFPDWLLQYIIFIKHLKIKLCLNFFKETLSYLILENQTLNTESNKVGFGNIEREKNILANLLISNLLNTMVGFKADNWYENTKNPKHVVFCVKCVGSKMCIRFIGMLISYFTALKFGGSNFLQTCVVMITTATVRTWDNVQPTYNDTISWKLHL